MGGGDATNSRKIMIVDDEQDIVDYMTIFLEDNGYEVASATDTDEIMPTVERFRPDLMLLDIVMPKKTGLAIYRVLKEEPEYRDMPILIVSAFSRSRDFPQAEFDRMIKESGLPEPGGYVEKPIDRKQLLELIGSLLNEDGENNNDGH